MWNTAWTERKPRTTCFEDDSKGLHHVFVIGDWGGVPWLKTRDPFNSLQLERTKPSSFTHSKIPSSDAEQPHCSRWEQDLQRDQSELQNPKKMQGTVEISWNMLKSLQNSGWSPWIPPPKVIDWYDKSKGFVHPPKTADHTTLLGSFTDVHSKAERTHTHTY